MPSDSWRPPPQMCALLRRRLTDGDVVGIRTPMLPTLDITATQAHDPAAAHRQVRVNPALILAPMSGVTDSPFRRLVKKCSGDAVGLVMSEFISIELLTRQQLRVAVRMSFHESERPVGIQLYGSDAGKMAEAAKVVAGAGAELVDINCGCPAPKVVRRGGGAGLLKNLPQLGKLIAATVAAVDVPVTVKIRNGWCEDSINALDTLRVAQDEGAAAISVHGRTRVQLYRGAADWGVVQAMVGAARIPVIGSGDVQTADDALRRFSETGCAGIMIGRGAITNPWIFRHIADRMAGRPVSEPTWGETLDALHAYLGWLHELYPPKVAPGRMRMMLSRLLKGFDAAPGARIACLKMETPEQMLAHLGHLCREHGVMELTRATGSAATKRAA